MKKILLGVFVLLIGVWAFAAFIGVEPKDRRPGTKLSGDAAQVPQSWTFVNDERLAEVHIETHPWYGVPFSVTTVIAAHENAVYVPSLYPDVMTFPGSKFWNKVVAADPNIRLRVEGSLYDMAIYPITDPEEFQRAFVALASKYPFWAQKLADNEMPRKFALLRVQPR